LRIGGGEKGVRSCTQNLKKVEDFGEDREGGREHREGVRCGRFKLQVTQKRERKEEFKTGDLRRELDGRERLGLQSPKRMPFHFVLRGKEEKVAV